MGFDLGGMVNSAFDWGTQMINANEEQHRLSDAAGRAQEFSAQQAQLNRDFESRRYQIGVADLKAAGLNPAMAYGGVAPLSGAPATGGVNAGAPRVRGTDLGAASLASSAVSLQDAQRSNVEADTKVKEATESEIRARTPTYGVQMDKLRQDISESQEKIRNLVASSVSHYASADQARQSVENMRAALPQIEATIDQLRSLSRLNAAQVSEVASRMKVQESQVREIVQKVGANLPAAERAFVEAKTKLKELEVPKAQMEAAPYTAGHPASAIGALSTVLRALNPLAGLIQIAK